MSKEIRIIVFDVVGSEVCVTTADGNKLYQRIHPLLKRGKNILLSFNNISMVTDSFFYSSIAPLYGDFDEELIRNSIVVEDMTPDDKRLLKKVTDHAKIYYRDPETYEQKMLEALKQ